VSIVSPEPLEAIDVPGEIERTFHSLEMTRGIPTAPMYLMSQMAVNGLAERIGYEAQYSSKSITDDPFDAMSHEEIWAKASSLKADTIDVTAHNWRNLGYNAATDAAEFASALSGTIGVDWQGIAADAAGQGVLRYSHSAVELVLASENLAAKVMQSHDAVVNTARLLGPPVPYGIGEKLLDANSWVTRTLSFGLIKSNQHMHEEAEEAARMVMKTHYAPVIRQAAIEVPVLPPAVSPFSGAEAFSSPSGYSGGASQGASAGPYGAPTSASGPYPQAQSSDAQGAEGLSAMAQNPTAAPENTSTQAAGWAPETASPGQTGTSPASAGGPNGAGGSAAGNPGAGSVVGGAGSPARSATGRSGSGFGGGGGGFGSGSGSGGLGGRSGSMPGTPGYAGGGSGAGSGAGSPGAGGIGRSGSPGMAGMGMAPAAGRGGPGGDDDVHATPGYLIDAVNGDELIGTLPLVAPPVLGE
jgi:hypothetical protein